MTKLEEFMGLVTEISLQGTKQFFT